MVKRNIVICPACKDRYMNVFYVPQYFPDLETKRKNVKMGHICMGCGNVLVDKEKLLKKEVT